MTSVIETLLREQENVATRQKAVSKSTAAHLETLIAELEATRDQVEANPDHARPLLHDLSIKGKDIAKLLMDLQRQFSATLTKAARLMDKNPKLSSNVEVCWDPHAFHQKDHILNLAICLHFIRDAHFGLSQSFQDEALVDVPPGFVNGFIEMFEILKALEVNDLQPAIRWCEVHRERLQELGSALEFGLHKARFVQILVGGEAVPDVRQRVKMALAYGKEYFGPFGDVHFNEIQRLTGAILYADCLEQTRYADLLSPTLTLEIANQFNREYCSLLGWSSESPLLISTMVGTTALPIITKIRTIMKEKRNEWTSAEELPVEVPLLQKQRYHSVFTCPVSKEQGTERNPPMMMPCGHVVCLETLTRLSKGNNQFKCPYCPQESSPSQAMKVVF